MENKNKNTDQYNNLYEQYHKRIEDLTNLYDARSLHFEMMEEKGDILKPILPKLRAEYTKKARALRDQERAADNGVITEKREKDIVADDITDITLTQAGYYWNAGYNEFDFTCKIKGEDDVLHMREQRHDDGYGIVIRSEKDDIWERITPSEAFKLEDKLQEEIQYGNYHKQIEDLTTMDGCKDLEFELMENDNVHLNRVLGKLWTELEAKEKEIGKEERPSVRGKIKQKNCEARGKVNKSKDIVKSSVR